MTDHPWQNSEFDKPDAYSIVEIRTPDKQVIVARYCGPGAGWWKESPTELLGYIPMYWRYIWRPGDKPTIEATK